MILDIEKLASADFGMYKCVAKNPRGQTDGTITLYGRSINNKNLVFTNYAKQFKNISKAMLTFIKAKLKFYAKRKTDNNTFIDKQYDY